MYISCPKCYTKFIVTSDKIGQDGRKVKCSKCSHIWHQELDKDVPIEPIITKMKPIAPIGNGVNLPALLPTKTPSYLFLLPGFVIGLIIVLLIMLFPRQIGLTALFNNDDVIIRDIDVTHNKDSEKLIVNYKIHNRSKSNANIPLIRISLIDANNNILKSNVDNNSHIELLPDQTARVTTEFTPIKSDIDKVDIMPGNKLDFLLY